MRTIRPLLLPRLIRLRDAPGYVGMDKNRFNREVRPALINVPIGKQGIAFDRLELDAWVEQYIACNGRPVSNVKGESVWDDEKYQGCVTGPGSGTSKSGSSADKFTKALARANSAKRN